MDDNPAQVNIQCWNITFIKKQPNGSIPAIPEGMCKRYGRRSIFTHQPRKGTRWQVQDKKSYHLKDVSTGDHKCENVCPWMKLRLGLLNNNSKIIYLQPLKTPIPRVKIITRYLHHTIHTLESVA